MANFFQEVANYLFGSYKVRATAVTVSNAPASGTSIAAIQHVLLDDGTGSALITDPLEKYKINDLDESTSTKYYGFTAMDGAWYILRLTSTTVRYVKGSSGYTTAWTNRASQSYDYFDVVF